MAIRSRDPPCRDSAPCCSPGLGTSSSWGLHLSGDNFRWRRGERTSLKFIERPSPDHASKNSSSGKVFKSKKFRQKWSHRFQLMRLERKRFHLGRPSSKSSRFWCMTSKTENSEIFFWNWNIRSLQSLTKLLRIARKHSGSGCVRYKWQSWRHLT